MAFDHTAEDENSHGDLEGGPNTIEDVEMDDASANIIEIGPGGKSDDDEDEESEEEKFKEDLENEAEAKNGAKDEEETITADQPSDNTSDEPTTPSTTSTSPPEKNNEEEIPESDNTTATVSITPVDTAMSIQPGTVGQTAQNQETHEVTIPVENNQNTSCPCDSRSKSCDDCGRYNIENNNYQGSFKVNIIVYEAAKGNKTGAGCG